jgi:hypothetical protein
VDHVGVAVVGVGNFLRMDGARYILGALDKDAMHVRSIASPWPCLAGLDTDWMAARRNVANGLKMNSF